MALETGTFVNDLVVANPPGTDGKSQGDDHLRLIKTTLKNTFPGATGALQFEDSDATAALTNNSRMILLRASATPAASDLLNSYEHLGKDSAGNNTLYARIVGVIRDPVDLSEDGSLLVQVITGGVNTNVGDFRGLGFQGRIGDVTPNIADFTSVTITSTGTQTALIAGELGVSRLIIGNGGTANNFIDGVTALRTSASVVIGTFDSAGLSVTALNDAGRPPTVQSFTVSGTWTKPAGCKKIIIEACGGGGGSGGVDGQGPGTSGASGGGGSGTWGTIGPIDVTGTASSAVTIGAAGAGGTSTPTNGGNGGTTSIALSLADWPGGIGSGFYTSNAAAHANSLGGSGGAVTGINQTGAGSEWGRNGNSSGQAENATGGHGGSGHYGRGGEGAHLIASGNLSGTAGTGFGSGGGGSCNVTNVVNVGGAAGTAGFMRIWEFY